VAALRQLAASFRSLRFLKIRSLAPSVLVVEASFTHIVMVLSFLRNTMVVQQTPPNAVLISLALFLTAFVMTPPATSPAETPLRSLVPAFMTRELRRAFKIGFLLFMQSHMVVTVGADVDG
jgi:flagellar biosynthetic protein FliP